MFQLEFLDLFPLARIHFSKIGRNLPAKYQAQRYNRLLTEFLNHS
jgi:hypothetical protein